MDNFEEKLATWLAKAQDIVNSTRTVLPKITLLTMAGKKYIRIVVFREENGQTVERSAYAFIDRSNGDVLKPDGWKGPAKHARGRIDDEKGGMGWCTPYGVESIR